MNFFKMHGCGNDFIVLDYVNKTDYSDLAVRLCDPHTGVGGDGLIVVKTKPLEMLIYNRDGSKAPMCGNGLRCFARYVYLHNLVKKPVFDVMTGAGIMRVKIVATDPFLCELSVGRPIFNNQMLHISDGLNSFGRLIEVDGHRINAFCLFMGTIHTVIFVESLNDETLKLAPLISEHSIFKAKTNVDFVEIISESKIAVRTYERGVGWTLACGTGACAAVVAAKKLALTSGEVEVVLPKGRLDVNVDKHQNVSLIGSAVLSYIGQIKECLSDA